MPNWREYEMSQMSIMPPRTQYLSADITPNMLFSERRAIFIWLLLLLVSQVAKAASFLWLDMGLKMTWLRVGILCFGGNYTSIW